MGLIWRRTAVLRRAHRIDVLAAVALCALACGSDPAVPELSTLQHALAAGDLVINEVHPNSLSPDLAGDTNGDGVASETQDEFVEIVNATSAGLDVSGVTVSDGASVRFTFPAGTRIPAQEAAVIFGGGTAASFRGEFGNARALGLVFTGALGLSNTGDTVTVAQGATVLDTVTFQAAADGVSFNRDPEVASTSPWVAHDKATGARSSFSPGTRVDGQPFSRTISRVVPATGLISGGAAVTIHGTGFSGTIASVTFRQGDRSAPATGVTKKSTISVTAIAPAMAEGPADVELVDALGGILGAKVFEYVASVPVDAGTPLDAATPPDASPGRDAAEPLPWPDAGARADAGRDARVPLDADDEEVEPPFSTKRPDASRTSSRGALPEEPDGSCGCASGGPELGTVAAFAIAALGLRRRRRA